MSLGLGLQRKYGLLTSSQHTRTAWVSSLSSSACIRFLVLVLSFEHYQCSYPHDNCAAIYPTAGNTPIVPQDIFTDYLDHSGSTSIVEPYVNSANIALAANKPFLMFETNSASCGGFPGVSNSFGAALWALDYGLQMAASNFSGALLHVGGQNVYYNVSDSGRIKNYLFLMIFFVVAFHS